MKKLFFFGCGSQRHIHMELVGECNEMSIRIKLHKPHGAMSSTDQALLSQARRRHPEPTWDEILELIDKCRDEMNQCTEPFRKR